MPNAKLPRAAAMLGVAVSSLLAACDDSTSSPKVSDPALYEPTIVREDSPPRKKSSEPRSLRPTTVSGVAMAPQTLFDGKLRLLVPQNFTQMPEAEVASLFKGGARPDAVFQSADKKMFLLVALLKDPMLPDQVKGGFEATKKSMLAIYPECTKRIETLAELDGRTWMRFDLDGEKRVMAAVTSLDGRTLRIETTFVSKPDAKWTEAFKKMWETAVIVDGHS
jgi:hypothetical protein